MTGNRLVSIIIPVLNEERHIAACVESLLCKGGIAPEHVEVLIADGGSTDGTQAVVDSLAERFENIRVLKNERRIQSAGFNLALAHASGEVVMRADAHATYDEGYVKYAIEHLLENPRVVNVGGIVIAVADNAVGRAVAVCTGSRVGNGGSHFRSGDRLAPRPVDTVPFGAWRRADIVEAGGLREEWAVNEDYELNVRLRKTGKLLLLEPRMRVFYRCRDSLLKLARQYYRYGFWRAKTYVVHPDAVRVQYYAPAILFVASTLTVSFLPVSTVPFLALHVAYILGVLAMSTRIAATLANVPLIAVTFAVMHFSFGLGMALGSLRWLVGKTAPRREVHP